MARRDYPDDDGRTLADMNVEGMPWYRPKQETDASEKVHLTAQESRWAMWGALKAALLVAAIFAGVFALFILFCDNIWLR